MHRRTRIAVLLGAVALAASACSSTSPTYAQVNEADITLDDLAEVNPDYAENGRNGEALRSDLTQLILFAAIETTAQDQYGIVVDDDDVAAFLADPPPEHAEQVAEWEKRIAEGNSTEGQMRADARSRIVRDAVTDELAADPEAVLAVYETSPELFSEACIRHVFTETEEEAQAARDRIDAGEDMAAVADDVSLDESSEGGLIAEPETGDCYVPISVFITEFAIVAADSPIGEVVGPFPSEFGWHVLRVEDRTGPASAEELAADPEPFVDDTVRAGLLDTWLGVAIREADIAVDPVIGDWSDVGFGITAPGTR